MGIFEKMGKSKFTEWSLNVVVIAVFVFIAIIFYWLLRPYEVITPLEGNYEIDKMVYMQGERFDIHLRICKNIQIKEDVFGRFIDGVIFSVPENTSNFEKGCYDTIISSVKIPRTLPTGDYIYREQIVYKVNPLREITYTFETPKFSVIDDGL